MDEAGEFDVAQLEDMAFLESKNERSIVRRAMYPVAAFRWRSCQEFVSELRLETLGFNDKAPNYDPYAAAESLEGDSGRMDGFTEYVRGLLPPDTGPDGRKLTLADLMKAVAKLGPSQSFLVEPPRPSVRMRPRRLKKAVRDQAAGGYRDATATERLGQMAAILLGYPELF